MARHSASPTGRHMRHAVLPSAVVAAAALLLCAPPALAGRPGGGGGTTATGTAMTVQAERLQQPYTWQDPCCFGVDDFMSWTVAGQIAPGDSYTYVPRWPISPASEVPDMSADLRWSGATTLRMTSAVPLSDQVTYIEQSVNHAGQSITAPVVSNTAQLCMFFAPALADAPFNYAITVTNVGTATATAVTLSGQESNGYTVNYAPFCNRADADADGWNDTLEQGAYDLTEPAATTSTEQLGALGLDYLSPLSATDATDDEVDSYPPDVNDDGHVDPSDVADINAWVGHGSGVPFSRVDYSGVGPNRYQAQSALWRRYDLNGDGSVTGADVAWVQAEVGRPVPDPEDVIAPWVAFDPSMVPSAVARRTSVWLGANARDNRFLTSVHFYADGTLVSQQSVDPMTESDSPTGPRAVAQPEYQCVWTSPSKAGQVTLTVVATDAAGNTTRHTTTITVS